MTRHIPNLLTIGNLLCGCVGVVYTLQGDMIPAAYFVWISCVFDFFDGFAARLLKVSSGIGKELDSLADMVSFGVLPAAVLFMMLRSTTPDTYVPFAAFLVAAFSAIRLAVFNLDETQRDSFKGLPTPANALFITALPLLENPVASWLSNSWTLIAIILVSSFLLVSRIELFALKFKNFTWADNQVRFTFLGLSVLLIGLLKLAAIPVIILLYVILSLGVALVSKKK
jgi:CDP-diacylglycerol--serine O-phosphatidyltransferase